MLSGARESQTAEWVENLLAEAGIAKELLEEVNARVGGEHYVALFRLLMDRLDDECMGLMSRPLRRGGFALVARSTLGTSTTASALRRVAAGFDLLLADVSMQAVVDDGLMGIALSARSEVKSQRNFLHELLLRVCWLLLAWLNGGKLTPRRFDFCFAKPDYAADYGRIFPGPLRFEQPRSAVWFDIEDLAAPMRRDAQALRKFLQHLPASIVLPGLNERAVSARVLALLRRTAPEWPDLGASARHLHMAVSTLQRHLAAEGVSFQLIKEQLRRDMAIVRLTTSDASLSELAGELGFSDSASFQRAFKRWTGSAPGAFRRRRLMSLGEPCKAASAEE